MKNGKIGCKMNSDRIGVLLAQLGTPDEPTPKALRSYLKQFLWDPRVIEINRALWWMILNGIILNVRPKKSAALYSRIWTEEGSPLLLITQSQTNIVQDKLKEIDPTICVEYGMRYGTPSLESAIDKLIDDGCSKILLVPMYPHYSAPTTASVYDAVFPHLLKRRFVPTLRVVEPFFAHDGYVKPQAEVIREAYASFPERPEKLILSYHGVPQSYVDKGDPYCCQCTETTYALRNELSEFAEGEIIHTYQSRFGNDPWLIPYTDDTIEELAKQGVKSVAIACPGFLADCLETLDEMGNEARELFEEHGGEELYLIPCLNTHPAWMQGFTDIITSEIGSWLETSKRTAQADCAVKCPVVQEKSRQKKLLAS